MTPALVIVAAVARNRVIGRDNRLLWRLPSDMKRFRALTLGKPLLMGRATFDSIGRPLPGRETVVVTRDPDWSRPGVWTAGGLDEALKTCAARAIAMGTNEVIIAGGGEVYAGTIALADRMHITEVDLAPAGDTLFPPIDRVIWREVRRETPLPGPADEAPFSFVEYARNPAGPDKPPERR